MQISSRFTIALHMFMCIHIFEKEHKITSDFLAESIHVNPVVIRRLLSQLKAAGLLSVQRGSGGASIAKPLSQITFLDVYRAVDCVGEEGLFHFHENPNPDCPVGRNVHRVLDGRLERIQAAMEREMAGMTLESVLKDMETCIEEDSRR